MINYRIVIIFTLKYILLVMRCYMYLFLFVDPDREFIGGTVYQRVRQEFVVNHDVYKCCFASQRHCVFIDQIEYIFGLYIHKIALFLNLVDALTQ